MWKFTSSEALLGVLGTALIIGIIVGVCWVVLKSQNKSAEKYKKENPNAATIWIVQQNYWGVKIKKVDGGKVNSFQNGVKDGSGGTYILPGDHVLTLEHAHADPDVNKQPEYKKQKVSTFKISVEPGKDYTLAFNEYPGQYSLVEGKPERK